MIVAKPYINIKIAGPIVAISLGLFSGFVSSQPTNPDITMTVDSMHGLHTGHLTEAQSGLSSPLNDVVVGFQLTDRNGDIVSIEDFRGEYVLLGFGFTHCPAVCPMMVLNMGKALRDTKVQAKGIFVSVDTERDTPAITDDYASRFGKDLIGLGGSFDQINAATSNFKVSYVVTKTQNNYTVQHTSNVFLINPEGKLADVFTFSTPAQTLIQAMH
jgi:cytochrome oxidase Cu insertion factor (SCO1/SenC/PrrC family)